MEDSLLVTSSLLDAFTWTKNAPASWRGRARRSLIATIRREAYTPHPAAQRGIDFEDEVYETCSQATTVEELKTTGNLVRDNVTKACFGGEFQKVLKEHISVDGNNVLLYGKTDVFFSDNSIDIKTTENWRGRAKYLSGTQHLIYTFLARVPSFKYLVVVFEYERPVVSYNIDYVVTEDPLPIIKDKISKLFAWLKEEALWDDYKNIYSKPRRTNNE